VLACSDFPFEAPLSLAPAENCATFEAAIVIAFPVKIAALTPASLLNFEAAEARQPDVLALLHRGGHCLTNCVRGGGPSLVGALFTSCRQVWRER